MIEGSEAVDQPLNHMLLTQWQQIRRLTYDYLISLDPAHLELRLPFPESQALGYQFWCMVGAHESYLKKLETGHWQGFSSSLDSLDVITPDTISAQMAQADGRMADLLDKLDLATSLANGQPAYEVVMQMIKHEMHHHGQLINYLFCHHLPIPASWHEEWALAHE